MGVRAFSSTSSSWLGYGSIADAPVVIDTGFVLGTTMPVWVASGDPANNVGPTGTLSNYAGTINFANGPVDISGLNITGKQTVVGKNHKIRNSRIVSTYSGDSGGGQFDLLDPSVGGVIFDRVECKPATPGDRYDAIYGHGYTATRCAFVNTVDGVKATNHKDVAGAPLDVFLKGSWLGWLSWYKDDGYAAGRPNSHGGTAPGTHNDGIQNIANKGMWVEGCTFQGARFNALNPTNVTLDPNHIDYVLTTPGNGVTPLPDATTGAAPGGGNGVLMQHDVTVQSPVGDATIINNWFLNWGVGLKTESDASKAFGTGQYRRIAVTFTGNRFAGVWKAAASAPYYWYTIRIDTNTILNGRSYQGRSGWWANNDGHTEDGNVWLPGYGAAVGSATPVPVYYRVDDMPVAQG